MTVNKNSESECNELNSDIINCKKNIKVLHIDDDTNCLMFTKKFLEMNDPSLILESAKTADEALKLMKDTEFDCVISDFKMPKTDGLELANEIKSKTNVPFIFYTGKESEEVAESFFSSNVDDYIRKEFDSSHYKVLAKKIRTAVENHRAETLFENVAEKSGGSDGRIGSDLSHDLRNPLQTIKNALFLMRRSNENKENLLGLIDDAVNQIVNILEDYGNTIKKNSG